MKHIRIPRKIGTDWLAALRSGNFKQGRGGLEQHDAPGCYCCLGVLEIVVDGKVELDQDGDPADCPSLEWLNSHNIQFIAIEDDESSWRGNTRNPPIMSERDSAAQLNDSGNYSFKDLADLLESEMEFIDENDSVSTITQPDRGG